MYEFDNERFDPNNTDTWGKFVEVPLTEGVTVEEKPKLKPAEEPVVTSNPYASEDLTDFEKTRQILQERLQTELVPVKDEDEENNQ